MVRLHHRDTIPGGLFVVAVDTVAEMGMLLPTGERTPLFLRGQVFKYLFGRTVWGWGKLFTVLRRGVCRGEGGRDRGRGWGPVGVFFKEL
jgi:hypothetical protein